MLFAMAWPCGTWQQGAKDEQVQCALQKLDACVFSRHSR